MKLIGIHVEHLFSLYSYNIDLKSEQDPNLKILTGPNGYGKSTLFSCIYALYSVNLYYFFKIQFDFIQFTFENGDSIKITQTTDTNQINVDDVVDDQEHSLEKSLVIEQSTKKGTSEVILKMLEIESEIKELGFFKKNNGLWSNFSSEPWEEDNEYVTDDIVRENPSIFDRIIKGNGKSILLFLDSLNAYLIKDQRLFQSNQSVKPIEYQKNKASIIANSEDLSDKIKSRRLVFATSMQKKESSLVDDIISSETDILEQEDYLLRLEKLKSQINVLRSYEIIDISIPTWSDSYSDDTKKILSVWIKNYESNLDEVFQDLLGRLNLLSEIIATKEFANKTLKIKNGYGFMSPQNKPIDIASLSSGEQHLIVMLYELLFKAAKGTLVLIDEPEISLHVMWQLNFLDDIIKISQMRDLQIIVATHSPQIIGEKWDFSTDLFDANLQK